MNNLPTTVLTDLLSEKIKRETSEEYRQFVNSLNKLANTCDSAAALEQKADELKSFLPHLDLALSITDDEEDILNMKATLLDLFVNDLNEKSIYLLSTALLKNKALTHLQKFSAPIKYWVAVIKSKEQLEASSTTAER